MSDCRCSVVAVFAFVLFAFALASASITGSISGVVLDKSGAVVAGATVVATDTLTGVQTTQKTDAKGFYNLPTLAVGTYDLEIGQVGFKTYRQTGLVIDANSALRVDASLAIGSISEKVEVSTDAAQVETTSTQMGEVIEGSKMTSVPLNGRSYLDLLALQPGVSPYKNTDQMTNGIGMDPTTVSGDLTNGTQSVDGGRTGSNGFMVNGADAQEGVHNGAAIIPNLDSISEFRIITNNFDAEYGNYSGGQINVVTKSGTNKFHGSVFEFLRNNVLNSRNYFDPPGPPGDYKQNQFGGTIGGPILHDKLFFFGDYQGNRKVFGQSTGAIPVPSDAERGGDFSDPGLSTLLMGTVRGPYWAQQLGTALGYTVTQGEPYYVAGCTSGAQCVFPNAMIPSAAFTKPSVNVLPYIPKANSVVNGVPTYTSAAAAQFLQDNKFGVRVDENSRFGLFSAYYFRDSYVINSPNPV